MNETGETATIPKGEQEDNTELTALDESHFKLDKDTMDALLLDAQAISPEEKAEFDQIVRDSHRVILKKLGNFISQPIKDRELTSKFIFTDPDTMNLLQANWVDDSGRITYTDKATARAFVNEGEIVVGQPVDIWDELDQNEQKK